MEFLPKPADSDPFDFKTPLESVGFNNLWVNKLIEKSTTDSVILAGVLQNPFREGGFSMPVINQPYNTKFRAQKDGMWVEFIAAVDEGLQEILRSLRSDPVFTLSGRVLDSLLPIYPKFEVLGLANAESSKIITPHQTQNTQQYLSTDWKFAEKLVTA